MFAAAGFGILIGAALGLLGGGGSILAVPALVYGVGESVSRAVTTSLFVVGVSAAVAVVPRTRAGQVHWPVAAVFGSAGVATAFAGAAVGHLLSAQVLLLAFAVLMVAVGFRMLWGRVEPRGTCVTSESHANWRSCLPKAIGAGAVVGFLTGLFGVGGGFVIVPALVLLLGLQMAVAIGTSLVVIVINSIAGLAAHLQTASIDWSVALVFAATALAFAFVTGRFGSRVESNRLRRWFGWLIIAVAVFVAAEAMVNPASIGK